jgi:hypothetical protein
MYIWLMPLAGSPPGMFTQTFVEVEVVDAPLSTHAFNTVPVPAGPVVNSTLVHPGAMYPAYSLLFMFISCWNGAGVALLCELVSATVA